MIKFWKIWTIFVLMIVAGIFGVYMDTHLFILENDFTYISFINLIILTLFTISVLYKSTRIIKEASDTMWFLSDVVLSIGMVGTLLGFLMVLYSTFQGLDVSNTDSMRVAIETLANGMGTALLTSLVGLSSSIIMKYQLVILES